jgi:glycosyltransferase involved in cell wall biosynthesis
LANLKEIDISIVVPCCNEEGNIRRVYSNILSGISENNINNYEIIFVNDGSIDSTLQELRKIEELDNSVKIISFGRNRGYGSAVRAGLGLVKFEYIFYIDGDGEFDFREYKKMLELLRDGFALVAGVRLEGRSDGNFRKMLANLGCKVFKCLFGITNIQDINCGFKSIRKSVLEKINLSSNSAITFSAELYLSLIKNHYKITQVPVQHFRRKYGYSKGISPKQYIYAYFDLFHNLKKWVNFLKR